MLGYVRSRCVFETLKIMVKPGYCFFNDQVCICTISHSWVPGFLRSEKEPIASWVAILQYLNAPPPLFSDSSLHSEEPNAEEPGPETADQSAPSPPPTLSMVELFNQRRQKLMQRKLRIAELSSSILENPQECVG